MPANMSELLNTHLGTLSLGNIISAVITLALCLLVIRFAMKIVNRLLSKTRLEARIQKYVRTGIKALLYVIAALMVVDSLGIETTSLVALLSVASLGITLAAEDILANLAGGIESQAKGITLSASQTTAAQPPIILQVDGKTFARLMTPYIDSQQGQSWGTSMRLGVAMA